MQAQQNKNTLTKPQRKLLDDLLDCVRADTFAVPIEVSIEINQDEVRVSKNLASKGLIRISETDERQVSVMAAALGAH